MGKKIKTENEVVRVVKAYVGYHNSCELGHGIVPGFATIPLEKWKKFQNFARKHPGFVETTIEQESTDGGHACSDEISPMKIWFENVCRVRSFPKTAYMTSFFDDLETFILVAEEYQQEGCQLEKYNGKICGDWISETQYDRCEKHVVKNDTDSSLDSNSDLEDES